MSEILLVAATSAEASCMDRVPGMKRSGDLLLYRNFRISLLITGVGSIATAYSLTRRLTERRRPDLLINAGIAGAFDSEIMIGEVVMVSADCFADLGIDTGKGFQTLFEAGLDDPGRFPFTGGWLLCDDKFRIPLPLRNARAVTVNTATGSETSVKELIVKYNPDIETMEGAAFFYICALEGMRYIALRSVSNHTGPRDKCPWDIPLALNNLTLKLKDLLDNLA